MPSSRLRAAVAGAAVLLLLAGPAYANQAPNAFPDSVTTPEDTAVTLAVTANDSDPDGDTVTLALNPVIQAPAHGTATRVSSTSIRYTPHANYFGTDTFRYRIRDGNGAVDSALVTVTVSEVNDPPVASPDSASTSEDVAVTVAVTANDSDPDGDPVTLITSPIVTAPAHGSAVKVSGSSIRYTPHADFSGTDTFRYEAGDGRGRRTRAWVTITVAGVNDPPSALPDAVTTNEDTAVTVAVTGNDSDPDGDALNVLAILEAPTHGTAVKVSSSSIRYTPHANYAGSDTFRYRIGDGNGAIDSALVTVTIVEVNDGPVAVDDTASTQPGEPVAIVVTANDGDVDGDPVTLIASPIVTPPAHGTAVKLDGSTIRYTPAAGFKGDDSFVYEIGDGRGLRARATVRVTVLNTPPVAAADAATAHTGAPTVIDVTANDSDPDGDTVTLIGSPIVTPAGHGDAVKVSGCCIQYTSEPGYLGQDTFQVEIGDGHGGRSRAWVTVTVTNQPPTAADDAATTREGVAVDVEVTANDGDPDGDAVRVSRISGDPSGGTAVKVSDSTIRYTPAAGFRGEDTFGYEVDDGFGLTSQATVTVTVTQSPPTIDLISPRYLPKETVQSVTVTGTGFEGATVSVPTSGNDPSRAYPLVEVVSHSATSLQLRLDMSDPAVEGYYALAVTTPGGSTAIDFRVLPPGPVVDSWSPSQVGSGSLYAITISGAQLAGAAVSATAAGVAVLQLDNSNDEFLNGILQVASGAPDGLGELVVDTGAGRARLPLAVGAAPAAATLATRAVAGSGSSSGATGPTIYLQDPAFSPEIEAMAGSQVVEKSGCLSFTRTRTASFVAVFTILFDPISDEILPRTALDALGPLDSLRFGSISLVIYGSRQLSIHVQFCLDGSDGAACLFLEAGSYVPGIGGQGFTFSACAGFSDGRAEYEVSAAASGSIFNAQWSASSNDGSPACVQVQDLDGASSLGVRQAEAQVGNCCNATRLSLILDMQTSLVSGRETFDFGEVEPVCDASCSGTDEGDSIVLTLPGPDSSSDGTTSMGEPLLEGSCIQDPLKPGHVIFGGCSNPILQAIAVIPENGLPVFTPANGGPYATDGLWVGWHRPCDEWFKIPDHCTTTWTCLPSGDISIESCCNRCAAAAAPLFGKLAYPSYYSAEPAPRPNPFSCSE